ncbi:MAG: hypothetical protein OXG96_09380, partial [Acidobacteria bacterium]|nr:hypothetical protein [Acidobacteriota bacterium]
PCINCGLQVFGSDETMRGAAANIFQAGADGIYLWNYHYRQVPMLAYGRPVPEAYGLLEDIQSVSSLQFRDKRFGVDYIQNIGPYAIASHPGQLPLELSRGNPGPVAAVELPVGDDLEAAGRSDRSVTVRLDLDFEGLNRGERIAGRLNGEGLALDAVEPAGADAPEGLKRLGGPVQAERVRQGINRLEVWVEKGGGRREGLRLQGVWLTVKYPPAA